MRFAHLSDCHLGSWRHPELQELNMACFRRTIDICIKEKLDFVIIAGDLFDSPYPPIEILKDAFREIRKLKDSGIPCFFIAGSHDFSSSGKTFLDVLENAGLCRNVFNSQIREGDEHIYLNPTIIGDVAIYGYPGKKTGLDVPEVKKIKLIDAPGFFKILMLHTSIKDAIGTLPIDSVDETQLPHADYYALGHLHIDYENKNIVYAGPTFPNNFEEIEELKGGSFYIVNTLPFGFRKIPLELKEVVGIEMKITNALVATEQVLFELGKHELKDKIVLLRLYGTLEKGGLNNIDFLKISSYVLGKGAYCFLKSTSKLLKEETEIKIGDSGIHALPNMEEDIIKRYISENNSGMNKFIEPLIQILSSEKKEDEKTIAFTDRIISESKRVLNIDEERGVSWGGVLK
ncbi:exonuclease SbcCD subunit D [Candidatus Pacearchaeota archaeon]|nr:exonuclease SbcCD subunit D [Candidatus Pacearchaeota archaeon]